MNEIEKKVRDIFSKYRNNLLCENCECSEEELNCKDCGVDKLEKITDKQAVAEIMAIMKGETDERS